MQGCWSCLLLLLVCGTTGYDYIDQFVDEMLLLRPDVRELLLDVVRQQRLAQQLEQIQRQTQGRSLRHRQGQTQGRFLDSLIFGPDPGDEVVTQGAAFLQDVNDRDRYRCIPRLLCSAAAGALGPGLGGGTTGVTTSPVVTPVTLAPAVVRPPSPPPVIRPPSPPPPTTRPPSPPVIRPPSPPPPTVGPPSPPSVVRPPAPPTRRPVRPPSPPSVVRPPSPPTRPVGPPSVVRPPSPPSVTRPPSPPGIRPPAPPTRPVRPPSPPTRPTARPPSPPTRPTARPPSPPTPGPPSPPTQVRPPAPPTSVRPPSPPTQVRPPSPPPVIRPPSPPNPGPPSPPSIGAPAPPRPGPPGSIGPPGPPNIGPPGPPNIGPPGPPNIGPPGPPNIGPPGPPRGVASRALDFIGPALFDPSSRRVANFAGRADAILAFEPGHFALESRRAPGASGQPVRSIQALGSGQSLRSSRQGRPRSAGRGSTHVGSAFGRVFFLDEDDNSEPFDLSVRASQVSVLTASLLPGRASVRTSGQVIRTGHSSGSLSRDQNNVVRSRNGGRVRFEDDSVLSRTARQDVASSRTARQDVASSRRDLTRLLRAAEAASGGAADAASGGLLRAADAASGGQVLRATSRSSSGRVRFPKRRRRKRFAPIFTGFLSLLNTLARPYSFYPYTTAALEGSTGGSRDRCAQLFPQCPASQGDDFVSVFNNLNQYVPGGVGDLLPPVRVPALDAFRG